MCVHVWRKRECTCGGRGSACVEEEGVHVWRKREYMHAWRERDAIKTKIQF